MTALTYKPHVDGLRAVAVLAVVFYHAYVPGFGGGYVGVDIFFVISGYLITALLYREAAETGDISLRNFAMRRVRRLAPALFVVLLACLIAGLIWLSPVGGEQQGLAKSAIATVALLANVYFWRHTGNYFDDPAVTHPLLHTWSLAVEEQFYLVWPWLILLAVRFAMARGRPSAPSVIAVIGVVFAVSLAICVAYTPTHSQLAFFLTPFRAWEFAAGAGVFFLLADSRTADSRTADSRMADSRVSYRAGGVLALAGLLAIGAAVFFFDKGMVFPGWIALLPVLGAAAVLLGCESSPRCLVARLLSLRGMVGVGLISYSLYLWHWPVLVYWRMATLQTPELPVALLLCVIAAALAWITYRWIENPVRQGRFVSMAHARGAFRTAATAGCLLLVVAASLGIWAKVIWPSIGNNRAAAAAIVATTLHFDYCDQPRPYSGRLETEPGCGENLSQAEPSTVRPVRSVLWGDSHAAHLVPAMVKASASLGEHALIRNIPECPPLHGARLETGTRRYRESCWRFNHDVVADLATRERADIKTLVLAARWRAYARLPEVRTALKRELRSTLLWATKHGYRVVIVAPVPEFERPVPPCLARRNEDGCGISREKSDRGRVLAMNMLREASAGLAGVQIVDPFDALCDSTFCPARNSEAVLYSDDNHLTMEGSEMLAALLTDALGGSGSAQQAPAKKPATPGLGLVGTIQQ